MARRISTVAALAVFFTACSSAPEDALVGSWESAGKQMIVRFSDGVFTASGPAGETNGHYAFDEDGKLRMEFDGMSGLFGVSVSEDRLTFCQENYRCEEFRRVK